jgi:hypothetical protein
MRRMILVLTVTAMLVVTALSASAQEWDEGSGKLDNNEPATPECGWYFFEETRQWDAWWEYWCYWRGWGWEYVFWVWD